MSINWLIFRCSPRLHAISIFNWFQKSTDFRFSKVLRGKGGFYGLGSAWLLSSTGYPTLFLLPAPPSSSISFLLPLLPYLLHPTQLSILLLHFQTSFVIILRTKLETWQSRESGHGSQWHRKLQFNRRQCHCQYQCVGLFLYKWVSWK